MDVKDGWTLPFDATARQLFNKCAHRTCPCSTPMLLAAMCNALRYDESIQELTGAFAGFGHLGIVPPVRYKVAPSEPAPVLTLRDGVARIDMMSFGLKGRGSSRQLMARGETAAELGMFREAFQKRRCLVIAHGFYDSEVVSKNLLQPWHFHRKGDAVMALAGLWEPLPEDSAFAIVSAPPNALVLRVIDRMPVILPRSAWHTWLNPAATRDQLQPLLTTYDAEDMEAWPVTRKVNKRGFDCPECIARLTEQQGDLGFL